MSENILKYVPWELAAPAAVAGPELPPGMAADARRADILSRATTPAASGYQPAGNGTLPQFTPIDAGKLFKAAAPGALAGVSAAGEQGQSYDPKSGILNTLFSGLSGAGSGAAIGTMVAPGVGTAIGAGAGALVGAVAGGLKAWMDVGAENKRKRDRRRLLQKAEADQKARDEIARRDALGQLKYDRRQTRLRNSWAMTQGIQEALMKHLNENQQLKDDFVRTGFLRRAA